MSNIRNYRVDIAGQDWYAEKRADGDYIAWRYVEPILEANKAMLEALEQIAKWHTYEESTYELAMRMYWSSRLAYAAIARAKGETP